MFAARDGRNIDRVLYRRRSMSLKEVLRQDRPLAGAGLLLAIDLLFLPSLSMGGAAEGLC